MLGQKKKNNAEANKVAIGTWHLKERAIVKEFWLAERVGQFRWKNPRLFLYEFGNGGERRICALGSRRYSWIFGLDARICTMKLGFSPRGWDLGLENGMSKGRGG